jgi:UDP-N-acetylglucosamine/UDP-N-acetylgalactosamine 4-epimerase
MTIQINHPLFTDKRMTWLVTGAAGFIGSHLLENLLQAEQKVVALDNFSTGHQNNIKFVQSSLPHHLWNNCTVIEGDIRDQNLCACACAGVDIVLHHAAIGSVPQSLEEPSYVDSINVGGFVNMISAASAARARRFIYASSSAVYGDNENLINRETQILNPQSPYAVGKYANELYAASLGQYFGLETIGFRYFNIYGTRQDPNGSYAAVIPKWIDAMTHDRDVCINGDGETYRDFCHVHDVVQANFFAAITENSAAVNTVYNIASGEKSSLNQLYSHLCAEINVTKPPVHKPVRPADIRISCADITKAKTMLGFAPTYSLRTGLKKTIDYYS